MTDLKPCPFCGGEAEVYEMQYGADSQYSVFGVFCVDDSNSWLIGLNRYQHGHFIDNFPTEAEAIEAWNTRAGGYCAFAQPTELTDGCALLHERTCYIEYPYYGDAPVINGQPRCSECKTDFAVGTFPNYCPNCGAKVVDE